MATARPELEEIAVRYAAEHRAAQREMHRDLGFTALKLVLCVALGTFLMGMGVHVTDPRTGAIYFLCGQIFWVISVAVTISNAFMRGVRRGDWR